MKKICCFILLFVPLLLSHSVNAQQALATAPFKLGEDYQIVAKPLPAAADIEFFYWFGSASSLQLEYLLQSLQQQHPDWSLRRTPVIARPAWRAQSYFEPLFTLLAEHGTLPSRIEVYKQCLLDCSPFANFEGIKSWLMQHMQLEEWPLQDESIIWQQSRDNEARAKKLAIWQVPTIIVRGRYQLNAQQMRTPLRAQQLIEYLHQQAQQ